MRATRVLVADDHAVVRAGLRSLLEEYRDFAVVGEAACGQDVLAGLHDLKPDVVLLDISMPDTVATECIERIRDMSPTTHVLVLTMHDDPLYMKSVLDAGATGYVTKSTAPDTLVEALRAVSAGQRFIAAAHAPNSTFAAETKVVNPGDRQSTASKSAAVELSKREREVLSLLARGYTYQEVADQLQVSTNSVGTYRSRIAVKLGVQSRAELVRRALETGLLD